MGAVAGFGGGFGGLPPGAVGSIPSDGRLQTGFEIGAHRLPSKFGTQLAGVNRVTPIMPGAVTHPVERIFGTSHKPQDHTHHGNIAHFTIRADQVCFADPPACKNLPHRRRVVFRMDPSKINLGLTFIIREFDNSAIDSKTIFEIPLRPQLPTRYVGLVKLKNAALSFAANRFLEMLGLEEAGK